MICYRTSTGERGLASRRQAAFEEPLAGAGLRGMTFHDGEELSAPEGGEQDLNCLDAAAGRAIWSIACRKDADAKVPMWNYASSPLVLKEVVTVFAGGESEKAVVGYNADTGRTGLVQAAASFPTLRPRRPRSAASSRSCFATETG